METDFDKAKIHTPVRTSKFIILFVLLPVGAFFFIWKYSFTLPADQWAFFRYTAGWTFGVYLVFWGLSFPWDMFRLKLFPAFILFLIPWLVLGSLLVASINSHFDTSDAELLRVSVLRIHPAKTRPGADVASWRNPGKTEYITIPEAIFPSLAPNKTRLRLKLRAGYLRFEWIEKIEVAG